MSEPKPLEEIAAEVLSDESIAKAVAEADPRLPTFKVGRAVNWLGRAATVKTILNDGRVIEIELVEHHTVSANELK